MGALVSNGKLSAAPLVIMLVVAATLATLGLKYATTFKPGEVYLWRAALPTTRPVWTVHVDQHGEYWYASHMWAHCPTTKDAALDVSKRLADGERVQITCRWGDVYPSLHLTQIPTWKTDDE